MADKCDICNNNFGVFTKKIEMDDGSNICAKCLFEQYPCEECGKIPESVEEYKSFFRLDGKIYCFEHSKIIIEEKLKTFILTSTPNIDGFRIKEYIGFDSVEIVIGTGLFSEFTSDISDFLGTRSSAFEGKLQEAKDLAKKMLKVKGIKKDANAIVAVDMDYTEFTGNRIGLILNGTLVKIEKGK